MKTSDSGSFDSAYETESNEPETSFNSVLVFGFEHY